MRITKTKTAAPVGPHAKELIKKETLTKTVDKNNENTNDVPIWVGKLS